MVGHVPFGAGGLGLDGEQGLGDAPQSATFTQYHEVGKEEICLLSTPPHTPIVGRIHTAELPLGSSLHDFTDGISAITDDL